MNKQSNINYNKSTYILERSRMEKNRSRNTAEHELVKALIVWVLQKKGYEVHTEVSLIGGGVCDVFIPEIPAYVEVLHSESDAMLKKKTEKYPSGLTQIVVRVKDVLDFDVKNVVNLLREALP